MRRVMNANPVCTSVRPHNTQPTSLLAYTSQSNIYFLQAFDRRKQ